MRTYVLSAIGRDRPGIIAAVAARLVAHGVNITDSQMGILRGHFAMTLLVALPDGADADALLADLQEVERSLELEAMVLRPVPDASEHGDEPTHAVTVYGADHPGIVAAITGTLARLGANVVDLRTRLSGELYVMHLEVALSADADEERIRDSLTAVAEQQGVDVTLTAADAEVL